MYVELARGPSSWSVGRCKACRQPIHLLAAEVIATADGGRSGTTFHARCFDALDSDPTHAEDHYNGDTAAPPEGEDR